MGKGFQWFTLKIREASGSKMLPLRSGCAWQDDFGGDSPAATGGPGVPVLGDRGSTQEPPQPFLHGRVFIYKGPFHL